MLSTISKIFSLLPEKNNLDFETRGVSFPKNIDIVPAYGLKIGIGFKIGGSWGVGGQS